MEKAMLNRVKNAYHRHVMARSTSRELNRLTDRELQDLGIARCDIDRISREGVRAGF